MKQKATIDYRTSKSERFFYGFYFFGQLIFFMLITNFLQLYMTDSGIPAVLVGLIFMTAKVWDAVNDPLFGIIVDKAHLKSGKYVPWVRLSSFLIPVTSILLFAMPMDVSVQIKAIWITVGYMLWDTSYTICDVPIFALATSMTDNIKERDWLYLFNRFFTLVGGLFVVILVPLMYPDIGWTATVIIMSVIAMATMIPIGFKAKERCFTKEAEKNPRIRELFHYLWKNKPLLIFSMALIITSLTSTGTVLANYVAIHCLGGVEWITIMILAMTIPMLFALLIVIRIVKKTDKFTIFMVCNAVNLLLGAVIYFAGYENIPLFLSLVALRSGFASAGGVLVVMFTADCAEYGHFITGERAQGVAFSIQTFTAKITAALSSSIGMFMLGAAGFIEGEGAVQPQETIDWLWRLYTIIPLVTGVLAFLFLLFFYKLRKNDVALMTKANAGEITREEALAQLTLKI